MSAARWHILTGEYPPKPGGVADYSYLVAGELVRRGADVHVWTGPAVGETPTAEGVAVHRDAGRWSPTDLARFDEALDALPPPRRLLVQYVPGAWGYRGMNVGFCRWLVRRRRRGDEVWAMIHEAFYGWYLRDKPSRWLKAAAHRVMIRSLLAASSRVFLSTPGLEGFLRPYEPGGRRPMSWLPVPSNVPVVDDPEGVAEIRRRIAPAGQEIIGNFGTYGEGPRRVLRPVFPPLLEGHPERIGLLMGRNSESFADELRSAHPGLAGRVVATGGLVPEALSLHLQACDLLAQPYDDGVSTRRGTVMAGLAHGRAIATTQFINTDPSWAETRCVALAPAEDLPALVRAAEALLADPDARARLGARAREVYDRRFSVERTVDALMEPEITGIRS